MAQVFGAEGHERAAKAGNIETLGRRVEGNGAGGDFRPERCKGNVLLPREYQVGVYLIRNDDESVFDGKLAQCQQFVTGKHPACRILRIAEYEDTGSLVDQLCKLLHVEGEAGT